MILVNILFLKINIIVKNLLIFEYDVNLIINCSHLCIFKYNYKYFEITILKFQLYLHKIH
jgi:DNA repair photolyase